MHLLDAHHALVQTTIQSSSDGQSTTNDGADTRQETGEGLGASLAVDDLHRGDIIIEEDTRDTASGVHALLVTLRSVITAHQRPLVRSNRVLMRFDAALRSVAKAMGAEGSLVISRVDGSRVERVPTQGQVGGRDDLDKIHEVEGRLVCLLHSVVQRVGMVVISPLPATRQLGRKGRTEAELVDHVRHGVLVRRRRVGREVILQVVRVHVHVREAAAWRNVEVAHHLVHPQHTLHSASLAPLCIDLIRVALALALLDVVAVTKRP